MVTTRSGKKFTVISTKRVKKRGKNMVIGAYKRKKVRIVNQHYQRRKNLNFPFGENQFPPLSPQPSEAVMGLMDEVAVFRDPAIPETTLRSARANAVQTLSRTEADIASHDISNCLENGIGDTFQLNNLQHQSMSLNPKPWSACSVPPGFPALSNRVKVMETCMDTGSHGLTRMIRRLQEFETTDNHVEHWIDESPLAAEHMRNPASSSGLVQLAPGLKDQSFPSCSASQPSEAAMYEVSIHRDSATVQATQCLVSPNADNTSSRRETVSNGHQQQSMSVNLTEFAEQCEDEDAEVDSQADSSLINIRGYRVKQEYANLLSSILSKHGDIGAECSLGSVCFRSFGMEKLCDIIKQLKFTSIGAITEIEIETMRSSVSDIGNTGIEVGWIKQRLDVIFEAKKAMPLLKSTSEVKQLYAEYKERLKMMKAELVVYKTHYTVKQAQALEFHNKIYAVRSNISAVEDEAKEADRIISESRQKLRKVWELGSLVNGLLDT